jgi:hypothetical protein
MVVGSIVFRNKKRFTTGYGNVRFFQKPNWVGNTDMGEFGKNRLTIVFNRSFLNDIGKVKYVVLVNLIPRLKVTRHAPCAAEYVAEHALAFCCVFIYNCLNVAEQLALAANVSHKVNLTSQNILLMILGQKK